MQLILDGVIFRLGLVMRSIPKARLRAMAAKLC